MYKRILKNIQKNKMKYLGLIIVFVSVFLFCCSSLRQLNELETDTGLLISFLSDASILLSVMGVLCFNTENYDTNFEYRDYLLDKLKESQDNEIKEQDIIALMLNNNDEIVDYFKISKKQAKSSFWFSIISCIIGVLMICLSLYGVFSIKNTDFAIIGIVGGVITELISGTVLVIHNKSALQLNYYYDALHENEKFLSAINLADKLEKDKKEQMYIEIIKAQIKSNENIKEENKEKKKNN